jgi:phosphatidylinositol dimannoside acyltransferase
VKHLISYLALRAGVGLIGLLPAPAMRGLGRVYGVLWHLLDGRRRRMARRHMRRVLGPQADVDSAAGSLFQSYGRYWAEALWVRARRVPKLLEQTRVDGLDHVLAARDAGKGMIYALPHMGNWEAAAPIAVREGVPVVAVAEKLSNRRITDWFTRMRAECGIEIVLATGSAQVMRSLEASLAQNKAVALPSDRDLRGRGVKVRFFGETTTLPPGPATLSIRTGAPLLPVVSRFDGDGFHVVVRPPIRIPDEGTRGEKVAAMTQELASHFEDFIRDAPEQWHLLSPNWPSDLDLR